MAVFNVSSSAELYDALANAVGGDTIELAGGDYGDLRVGPYDAVDGQFASNVTITSADPEAPASFSGMMLNGASNITFDNVVFDYVYSADDAIWQQPFGMNGSAGISIINSTFDGDVPTGVSSIDDGVGNGYGLFVRGSSDITLDGNEFQTFRIGLTFAESSGIEIINNDIHSIRSDGMNFLDVQDVLIEGNYLHDFEGAIGSEDHRDMIQFWTGGTDSPSTNIIIRDNLLDIGEGDWTQSIFMRNDLVDQGLAGPEMFYQNILIENNTIYNGHVQGIMVGETNGLIIRNNSVVQAEGRTGLSEGGISVPLINLAADSTNVQILSNITGGVLGFDGQNDWTMQNNAFVQNSDPNAPGYYGNVFFSSSMNPSEGVHEFVVIPGSMIDALSAGSANVQLDTTPDELTPVFDVTSLEGGDGAIVFDASATYGPVDMANATIEWDFGDGAQAIGAVVQHVFGVAGVYNVTMMVTLSDGTVASAYTAVEIVGDAMVSFDSQSGQFINHASGFDEIADGSVNDLVATADGYGIQMGGTGFHAIVDDADIARIFGADNFEMSMTIRADVLGASSGEILRLHQSFIAEVDQNGALFFRLFTDDGSEVRVRTQSVVLDDGQPHEIRVVFNGAEDSLEIWIDGSLEASETVTGNLPESVADLTFGNGWGQDNFDGKLMAFYLNAVSNDYKVFDGTVPLPPKEGEETQPDPLPQPGPKPEPTSTEEPEPAPEPAPTEEPTDTDPPTTEEPTPVPEPEPTSLPDLDDFILNLEAPDHYAFHDDATVVDTAIGPAILLDGRKDFVDLGDLTQFEGAEQLSFTADFTSLDSEAGNQRLVWNEGEIGLTMNGDSLKLNIGQDGRNFRNALNIENLGINDGAEHTAMVIADTVSDRLQVLVDDEVVFDQDVDGLNTIDASHWVLGSAKNNSFDGLISDFRIEEGAEFVEGVVPVDDTLIIA